MATPLDIGALKAFDKLFTFILVTILVYAFLSSTALFKERKLIAALVAVLAGLLTLTSNLAIQSINLMAPWFVLFVIFALLMMLGFMLFGYDMGDIKDFVTSGEYGIGQWVWVIIAIIGIGSVAAVWNMEYGFGALTGENVTVEEQPAAGEYGFWETIFHPKILGMALVLLIAFFTVKYMSED